MSLAGQDIDSRHYIKIALCVKGKSYRNQGLKSTGPNKYIIFFYVDNFDAYPQSEFTAQNSAAQPSMGPDGASQESVDSG